MYLHTWRLNEVPKENATIDRTFFCIYSSHVEEKSWGLTYFVQSSRSHVDVESLCVEPKNFANQEKHEFVAGFLLYGLQLTRHSFICGLLNN